MAAELWSHSLLQLMTLYLLRPPVHQHSIHLNKERKEMGRKLNRNAKKTSVLIKTNKQKQKVKHLVQHIYSTDQEQYNLHKL